MLILLDGINLTILAILLDVIMELMALIFQENVALVVAQDLPAVVVPLAPEGADGVDGRDASRVQLRRHPGLREGSRVVQHVGVPLVRLVKVPFFGRYPTGS